MTAQQSEAVAERRVPEEEDVSVTIEADPSGEESTTQYLDALSAERRKKREDLSAQGIDPYPSRFDRTATAAELHTRHGGLEADQRTGETVRMAGRLTSIRGHGKLSFATLHDVTGSVQLLMQQANLSDQAKSVLAAFDLGTHPVAEVERGQHRLRLIGEVRLLHEQLHGAGHVVEGGKGKLPVAPDAGQPSCHADRLPRPLVGLEPTVARVQFGGRRRPVEPRRIGVDPLCGQILPLLATLRAQRIEVLSC